jgi:hypothetical protein
MKDAVQVIKVDAARRRLLAELLEVVERLQRAELLAEITDERGLERFAIRVNRDVLERASALGKRLGPTRG